ncbi:MAG: hypothetical protein V4631_22175 [Pseudomonadota bacterium]
MSAKKTTAAAPAPPAPPPSPKAKKDKPPRLNASQTPPDAPKRKAKIEIAFPPSADDKRTHLARLDELGVEIICDAIRIPMSMREISDRLNISQGTLIAWISTTPDRSARVRDARIATAQHWDNEATELIAKARTPFQLAKAKELAHHFRWRAAKIAPKDYGDKLAIGGASDLPPVQTVAKLDVSSLSTEALAEIMRAKDRADAAG